MATTFKKYLGNTTWLMSERVMRVALNLVVTALLARYLGTDLFGQFSYALSLVALLAFLNELGLDSVLVKELVDHPQRHNEIKGTAFVMKVAGTTLMCALLIPLCLMLHAQAELNSYVAILAIGTFFQCFVVIDYEFQAKVESKYVAYCLLTQSILGTALKIGCILTASPLVWIVVVQFIESAILAAGLIYVHQLKTEPILRWSFNRQLAMRLMKLSWPLLLSGAAVVIYMKIDQVMIKTMLTASDVGLYGVAARISEAVYFIPGIIAGSLFPAIIAARGEDYYQQRLQNLYDLVIWIAILIAVPVTVLAPNIVSILFGDAYEESAQVLMLHVWASLFVFFGVARGRWIVNEGLQRAALLFTLAGAVANVLLNLLLIPVLGILGAAIATVLSVAVATVGAPMFIGTTRTSVVMFCRSLNLPRVLREGRAYIA